MDCWAFLLVFVAFSTVDNQSFRVPSGAIDFSECTPQADGRCCITSTTTSPTISRQSVLECHHKKMTSCHYTYVTVFKPYQETVCSDSYQKKCQINFHQKSVREKVRSCHKPLKKVCGGPSVDAAASDEICRTYHQTSCTHRYVETGAAKVVGHSSCSRIPRVLCGDQCRLEEDAEECYERDVDTVTDTPEESCDLTPIKTCHTVNKLTPILTPKQECTAVPQEVCSLGLSDQEVVERVGGTVWCREAGKDGSGRDHERKSKIFHDNLEVNPKDAFQASHKFNLSQMTRKTIGIGSSFVFDNEISHDDKNLFSQRKTSQSNREPKTVDLNRQSKQLESISSKDKKAGTSKIHESMRSYLPSPGSEPRQANTELLPKTGIQKTEKNALLHLPHPSSETKQNRHGKINRNPTEHKQKPKARQISHLLPPPQIVKKTFGIRGSFPFENLGNNSNQWKDILVSKDNNSGQQKVSNWIMQQNTRTKDLSHVPSRKQNIENSKTKKQSRKESRRSYLPKPGLDLTHTNKEQLSKSISDKTEGMDDKNALFQLLPPPLRKVQNKTNQKLIKQTKPSQKPHHKKSSRQHSRQGKSYSSTLGMEQRKKNSQKTNEHMNICLEIITNKTKEKMNKEKIKKLPKDVNLPFYSLRSFPSSLPGYARPPPAGLAALASFSQKNYEQYREV